MIKLSEVKNFVFSEMDKILLPLDFKFSKSQKFYSKNTDDGKVEIAFEFFNFYPLSIDFHFVVLISNNKLNKASNDLCYTTNLNYHVNSNLALFDGDFVDGLKNKSRKFRSNYKHSSSDLDDLKLSVKLMISTIQNNQDFFLSLTKIDHFLNYFHQRKGKILLNLASNEFLISLLMAAHLIDKIKFIQVLNYLDQELVRLRLLGDEYPQSEEIVSHFKNHLLP